MDKPRTTLAAQVNALSIALVYATFAGMWILLSDKAVAWLFIDPRYHLFASTLKGSLFVAVTAILLYFLVRRLSGAEDQLRALKMLAAFADNTEDVIYALDQDRRFILVNRVAERFTGKTQAELLGSRESTLFPPDVAARIEADNLWVLEHGCSRTFEETLPLAGNSRTLLTTKCPLRDETGEIVGLLGVAHDITDRQQAEAALRASEERLTQVLAAIQEAVWDYRFDTGQVAHNPRWGELLDLNDGLLTHSIKRFFERVHPDDLSLLRNRLNVAYAHDTLYQAEYRLRQADGSYLWVADRGRVVERGPQGQPLRMVGAFADISASKAAEEALRARERYIRALFNNFPFMVWLKDRDGRYLAANREVATAAHVADPESMIGKTDQEFQNPDQARRYQADDQAVLASGHPRNSEEEITTPNRHYWLETYKSPVELDGAVIGTVGYARDITERKQAEAALVQATDDLAATLQAIPDLLFELDETGRYIKVEATAHYLLAAPADLLLGHTVDEMLPTDAARTVMASLAEAAQTGTDYGRQITLPLADGPHHFELSVARKTRGTHPLQHFIVLSRDITQRKESEDELLGRNQELQRFNIASIGREVDMVDLKKQVNALSRELGRSAPYDLRFLDGLE